MARNNLTIATVAALLALSIAAGPARADVVYTCDGGAWLTYVAATQEMRINLTDTDGIAIALPLAIEGDHIIVWSTHGEDSVDNRYTPRVPYVVQAYRNGQWFPEGTPQETSFDLGSGERRCREVRRD